MPVKTEDRPIKKIREEVIDQLVMNYGHDIFEKIFKLLSSSTLSGPWLVSKNIKATSIRSHFSFFQIRPVTTRRMIL